MSFLLRRRITRWLNRPLDQTEMWSGISTSLDKSGLEFCAAPCTFSPAKVCSTSPSAISLTSTSEQTVGAEAARQTTCSRPEILFASAEDLPAGSIAPLDLTESVVRDIDSFQTRMAWCSVLRLAPSVPPKVRTKLPPKTL